jgi:hypothetical protein
MNIQFPLRSISCHPQHAVIMQHSIITTLKVMRFSEELRGTDDLTLIIDQHAINAVEYISIGNNSPFFPEHHITMNMEHEKRKKTHIARDACIYCKYRERRVMLWS